MRKNNFKLIRKTLEWKHRKRGGASLSMPEGIPTECYSYFKIFGNGTNGVGSYESNNGTYAIPIHIHGKNLMSGEDFVSIHSALNVSKITPTVSGGFYSFTPLQDCNGTVVIGPDHIKFKKKTAYTLALHLKYVSTSTIRRPGLRFDYSDGSYYFQSISTSSREFRVCISSDPNKDLVAISSHAESSANVRFGVAGFGIYEGAHSNYDSVHEAYSGQRTVISLNEPLRKIDYASDLVDIIGADVTRKIQKYTLDGSAELSATDEEGVYFSPLPSPMRKGSRIVAELSSDGIEISPFNDGSGILIKAPDGITSSDGLLDLLSLSGINVFYVRSEYSHESITPVEFGSYAHGVSMDILSETEPSKIITEYTDPIEAL